MTRALALAAVAVLLLGGCDADVPGPGRSDVDVDTPALRELKAEAGVEDCVPGDGDNELPALTLPCLGGGESVDLSTLSGPMIINVWGSYCGPCRKEMPALQQFHRRYGDTVPVLGIDLNDTQPDAALALARDTGATYPSLADPDGDLQERVRVVAPPTFIWLRADGSYTQSAGGLDSLDEVVEQATEHLGVEL